MFKQDLDLNYSGKCHYNFTSTGFFTLLNREGNPLYQEAVPFFEKLCSHLLWILIWSAAILLTGYLKIFMPLIFLHIFLFGSRLTTLLIKGGLKPILFPPLWVRLTRKGKGIEILQKHNLHEHPGLLSNLALKLWSRGDHEKAKAYIQKANTLCPDHPILNQILTQFYGKS